MKFKSFIIATMVWANFCSNATAQTIAPTDKVLIAYYSRSGNTKEIAEQIKNAGGGDLFEIIPVNAYPDDYRQTTEQAQKEIKAGYKPELKSKVANIADYDVIFIGSPCWWGTIASPVSSFLSEYDLAGKKVIPFMTHGGSGLGHSVDDIKTLLPNATVTGAKAFWGRDVKNANNEVSNWIKGLQND